jgi:aspartyl-tRNA(Asn)/glutamyl-tRNA(Gln) amidotransferase subunit C
MSNINESQVAKVFKLAKIATDEAEIKNFTIQIDSVLSWVAQLNNLDTSQVEPLGNVFDAILKLHQDKINQENTIEDVFSNTNHSLYNYFTVPKVIE